MEQVLYLSTRDADTGGLERIQFKLGKEDARRLAEEMRAFKKMGSEFLRTCTDSEWAVSIIWGEGYFEQALQLGESRIVDSILIPESFYIDWQPMRGYKLPRGKTTRAEAALKVSPSKIEAFESERKAFLKIKDSLLGNETYRGKFVAVYEGDVVDVDDNIKDLARRVYEKHGYVPIYFSKVQEEKEVVELPSPER